MPKEAFLHYLTSNKEHKQCKWLNHLPKKLDTSIYVTPVSTSQAQTQAHVEIVIEGWGVRILEGPNSYAIFWTSIFVIVVIVIVCITYLAASGSDVQGAAGLGALIAALWAIAMPSLYLKWSVT